MHWLIAIYRLVWPFLSLLTVIALTYSGYADPPGADLHELADGLLGVGLYALQELQRVVRVPVNNVNTCITKKKSKYNLDILLCYTYLK